MNWLLPRYDNPQPPREFEAQPRDDAGSVHPDPYRNAPLGVECAWPAAMQDATSHTPT
jgi:hypothetical protein